MVTKMGHLINKVSGKTIKGAFRNNQTSRGNKKDLKENILTEEAFWISEK
jgi:hypothetical protein